MASQSSIDSLPLFACLSETDRQELAKHAIEVPIQKGQFIFREGDPADWFHIVQHGNVKCVKSNPEGREVTLKVLMPGDLFCCEASAFSGDDHPGCAQSMGDGTVIKIHRKAMLEVIQKNPEAAVSIINYLSHRLRESQDNAKAFALDRAEQRVATLLVNLAERSGIQEEAGIRITVRLTHQDLADMAGLTKETTSRILSRFKKDLLITGHGKQLVIANLPLLRKMAPHPLP
ncbi:MAG: Crp/Fnr family transcriptional regulator [Nitrospirota bacterium]|nr:Crp/Fnr family transcriptional regulator [Nitrospirota bacterium]MDH5586720.1 Crp/Fnr family transcriptional regulator [Nitrospirota bacterium]MDH5775219.1 Crp/Fnr family transcriptional regulator [Nitrospirota bacterium]